MHARMLTPAFAPDGEGDAGFAGAAYELLGADDPLVGGGEDAADAGHVHLPHLEAAGHVRDHVGAPRLDGPLAHADDSLPLVVAVLLPRGEVRREPGEERREQQGTEEAGSGAAAHLCCLGSVTLLCLRVVCMMLAVGARLYSRRGSPGARTIDGVETGEVDDLPTWLTAALVALKR